MDARPSCCPATAGFVASSPAALNIVLPSFCPTRLAAWFAAAEDVFWLQSVTDQHIMFAYAYTKLEAAQMQQVDDILELWLLPLDAFTRLRDHLVLNHSSS